jgi:hypothetical protein
MSFEVRPADDIPWQSPRKAPRMAIATSERTATTNPASPAEQVGIDVDWLTQKIDYRRHRQN